MSSGRAKFVDDWYAARTDAGARELLGAALVEKHRPLRSIAAGHDCADLRRVGVCDLSLVEQMALSCGRLYMQVLKISGALGGRGAMQTLRGHCITFPQPLAAQHTMDFAAQVREEFRQMYFAPVNAALVQIMSSEPHRVIGTFTTLFIAISEVFYAIF